MDEFLIEKWNAVVQPDDEVLVVGDVCMGDLGHTLGYISRLNGFSIRLLVGNHDRPFRKNGVRLENWESQYLDAGFSEILHGEIEIDLGMAERVRVCHFPYQGDSGTKDRYKSHRPADDGTKFLLHGHTHGKARRNGRMLDVGVDAWGGRLVAESEVVDIFSSPNEHQESLPWLL